MAATLLSVVFANSSGVSVTVPTGAQGVVAFASNYGGGGTSTLNTISLGGASSFTIARNILAGPSSGVGQAVAHATITTTGSQTLSFTFTAFSSEGPIVALAFFNGINTSDWVRATDANGPGPTTQPSATLASSTTDVVIAFHQRYGAAATIPSGWTSQGTNAFNTEFADVSTANSPGASTTTYTAAGTANYSTLGIVSIKGASAATTASLTGSSATASAGTLGRTLADSATGVAAASAAGTLGRTLSDQAAGIAAPAGIGALRASLSDQITGQASTGAPGTTSTSVTVPITGAASTAAAGTVSAGSASVLALSGQAATAAAGALGRSVSYSATGAGAAAGVGTARAAIGETVSGVAAASAVGAVGDTVAAQLAGASATASAGTLGAGNAVNRGLSGAAATAAVGALAPSISEALSGQAASASPGTVSIASAALPISLGFDGANPEHIALRCPITGTVPEGTLVRVEHKLSGASTWRQGPFLKRVRLADLGTLPTEVAGRVTDSFVGMAFAVAAASASATVLDVRLAIYPPASAPVEYVTGTHTLRALAAAAPAVTHTCTPATFAAVLASLPHASGTDVHLRMGAGTYTWSAQAWAKGGTLAKPIYVSAANLGDVIISTPTGTCLLPQTSHVVMERLRFQGSGTDSGTAATSEWMQIPGGAPEHTNWSVRDCEVLGFDRGAVSFMPVHSFDFRRTKFIGNNAWAAAFMPNGFGSTGNNATWNDHGICLPGTGNSATNCEIKGHGDSWRTYANSSYKQFTAGCGMTRCDIRNSGDDMAEFDGTAGNSYAFECRGVNVGNGISADDTYGPAYAVKCLVVNPSRGPLKLTSNSFGTQVLNCTFVMTVKGPDDHGILTPGGGTQDGFELVNCAVRYTGAGNALFWSSGLSRDVWANNGWFPDRNFYINGVGAWSTLAAAKVGNAARFANDVLLGATPFVDAITLGANCSTEYTGTPTGEMAAGNPARAAGVAIAGITDGFSGAAPDIGAFISGQAAVQYGVPTSVALPSWVPAAGEVAQLTVANGGLANNFLSQCTPWYTPFYYAKTANDYSGSVVNPYYGTYGAAFFFGGGHSATNDNTLTAMVFGATQVSFKRLIDGSPIFGTGTDSTTQGANSITSFNGAPHLQYPGCRYAVDGKPASPHSYGLNAILPPGTVVNGQTVGPYGAFFIPMIPAATYYPPVGPSSVSSFMVNLLGPSTAVGQEVWTYLSTHPTYPEPATQTFTAVPAWSTYLGDGRHLYLTRASAGPQPQRYVRLSDVTYQSETGASLVDGLYTGESGMVVLVPERGIVLFADCGGVGDPTDAGRLRIRWAPISSLSTVTKATMGSTVWLPALASDRGWNCITWCNDSARLILGDTTTTSGGTVDNTSIVEIELPATLTDPWPVTRVTLPGGATLTWSPNSTYGDWSYNPKTRCIVYMPTVSSSGVDTVLVYRPRNTETAAPPPPSASLSGQAASATAGTLGRAVSYQLTGRVGTTAAGAVGAVVSAPPPPPPPPPPPAPSPAPAPSLGGPASALSTQYRGEETSPTTKKAASDWARYLGLITKQPGLD